MKKAIWGMAIAAVIVMSVSAAAFAWDKGTHAYIADLVLRRAGAQNIAEMYGATVPDAFNTMFAPPSIAYQGWLYAETHFDFMKIWNAAKTENERSAAAGFLTHNNVWGADVTAHAASLTLDPGEGYVVTKAKLLHSLLLSDPGYAALFGSEDVYDVAIEICHNLVEAAGDVIIKRNDPDLGKKLASVASRPKVNFQKLMAAAYGDELSLFSLTTPFPMTPDEAAGFIAQAESDYRTGIIGYGYLLQGDEATLVENIVNGYVALAGAFLAAYGLPSPPQEMLVQLVSGGIALAIDICSADYMTEVNATVDYVAAQLRNNGIR